MTKMRAGKKPLKKRASKKTKAVRKAMSPESEESYGIMTNTERLRPGGIPRTRKKVAIVGFASSSMREVMPLFEDPDFEIWSINQLYMAFPEITKHTTRWFQIHARKNYDAAMRDHKHSEWMGLQRSFPIYMQEIEDDIPMSVKFPLGSILNALGDYFTNSISWELALAIYEGFEEIHVYGVDMAQDDEYCLSPETRILTADLRWVELRDIKVGQEIIAFDENVGPETPGPYAHRQWRVATVTHAGRTTLPCYKICLADGTEFVASEDHPWLTYGEHQSRWKLTKELDTLAHREDRPTKIVKVTETWKESAEWEAGYLAAALDGEGFVTQNEHRHCNGHGFKIGFSQNDNAMARKVRFCLETQGFDWSENLNGEILNFNIKGGRSEMMRMLGQVRPRRLLDKFDPAILGSMQRKEAVAVESAEFVGDKELVALQTSTKTFVAEGFATHNTEQRPSVEFYLGWIKGMDMARRLINEAGGIKGRMLPRMKLYVPDNSDLMKAMWLYPFEDDQAYDEKIRTRIGELRMRAGQMAGNEQALRDQRMQLLGAADNMRYIRRNWRGAIRELRLGQGRDPSARPRVNLLDGTFIDEEKQAEAETKLRQPPGAE